MHYKKCPNCELNYIAYDEELCEMCRLLKTPLPRSPRPSRPPVRKESMDFSHIARGCVYGTNSRRIYEEFCDTLGWDKNQKDRFGWQTPLYAANADTDRKRDVWFICYPNYDPEKLDKVVDDRHVVNLIKNNGDIIIEVFDEFIGKSNAADTITFIKNARGQYEFIGVYTLQKGGTTRVYQRISDCYPIQK